MLEENILMDKRFMVSLTNYLVEKDFYLPITGENEVPDFEDGTIYLIREKQGNSIMLGLIDGDSHSPEQVRELLLKDAQVIENIQGRNAYIFKVCIFKEQPSEEYIRVLEEGQIELAQDRKFLKCLSVNLSSKRVAKHFSVPNYDAGIVKSIEKFLKKDYQKSNVTPEQISMLIEKRKSDFQVTYKVQKPLITYAFIAVNIIVYFILSSMSNQSQLEYQKLLLQYGSKVNSLILDGQYFRFISPMFLHGDIVHLMVNCYSLFIVGSQVERLMGRGKFVAVYFVSGILGNIASFAFSSHSSVGASGALFGLMGVLLYFVIKRPALLKSSYGANLITTLIINITYGFMNTQIDNHAHLGGLLGGVLCSAAIYEPKPSKSTKTVKLVSAILLVVVFIGGLAYSFNSSINHYAKKIAEVEKYSTNQQWEQSEQLAEEILAQNPDNKAQKASLLWDLIYSEAMQAKYDQAVEHGKQLVEVSPADGHYLLGVIYYDMKEYQLAKNELENAKKVNSPYSNIDVLLEQINTTLKQES